MLFRSVDHVLVNINYKDRFQALRHFIFNHRGKMIVFFNTIKETDLYNQKLRRSGIRRVDCIHSKRDQDTRERLIQDFRSNKISVLLASDVAARGIDIPNVELVINFDLPNNSEEYIHRVGRTGRAGKLGMAISFYHKTDVKDDKKLKSIEKLIKGKIRSIKNYKDLLPNHSKRPFKTHSKKQNSH